MLHLVIQAAMGWTNSHLWLIHARGCTWGAPDPDYPDDTIPADRTFLLDMIAHIGTNRFEYVYDLGDHWSHTIKIVEPMPAVPGIDYPTVDRCCRPLPAGGQQALRVTWKCSKPYATRPHPRHAEVIEWPGPDFDPNDADCAKLETGVAALAKLMTPRRRASAKPKPKQRRKRSDHELFSSSRRDT
jgi:hypothetical protein